MTIFDPDAWMQRGAERKRILEDEYDGLYRLLGRGDDPPPKGFQLLLAMELLRRFQGTARVVLENDARVMSAINGAGNVAERHLKRKAASTEEYNMMLLDLAKKILDGATTDVVDKFGEWESKTFREKVSE